jgi:hypothetical protein
MIDLEERITETLQHRAPLFVRPMPKGTLARVRLRQMIAAFEMLTLVAALAGAVVFLSAVPRSYQPAARQTIPAPSGVLPSPQGVQGGVDDATSAPTSDPVATEDTAAHGTISTVPYTEQVQGQEAYLLTQKHVVAFGHVSGIEWSLAAYDTRPYSGDQFPRFLGGQCGDLMVGDQGEYGGIEFCLHTDETASDAPFAMAGFGNASDQNVGPITGYAGLVGNQVSTVELRLSNGETTELTLYDAPSGIDARYFEVFVTAGTAGRIVAVGSDGAELGSGSLCVSRAPSGPDNVGCGHGLVGVSSVVTSLSEPPSTSSP